MEAANLEIFSFTGGAPQPIDLAPSIVFSVLYGLSLPVLIWRVTVPATRTWILLRPATFLLLRLGMYILRAVMSINNYDVEYLRGEAALVNISFLILLFPVLDLWRRHILTTVQRKDRPKWVRPVICYVTLVTSIILSIATATTIDERGTKTPVVRAMWRANYILSFATVLHTEDPDAPVRSRAAFYILEGATDWVVLAAILAININTWFPGELVWKKEPYEPDEAAMTAPTSDMVSTRV